MTTGLRWTQALYEAFLTRTRQRAKPPAPATPARTTMRASTARAPSEIECLLTEQIALAQLPAPQREYRHIRGRRYRLDFAWPEQKIGLEVQGMVHRIKGRFRNDIEKRALGLLAGWRILEVDGAAVRSGRALRWIEELLGCD